MSPEHYVNIQKQQLNIKSNNNTSKANPDDNTLKTNPALYKHTTRSVIRVRLLFHIDFFEISIILRIPKIPKEKNFLILYL